jgi:iron complex outermembrane receptor protein
VPATPNVVIPGQDPTAPVNLANCSRAGSQKSNAPGWELGLDDQITDKILIYGKVSRGYKAGGFNNYNTAGVFAIRPEFVTATEIGLKADWNIFGVRARTNLTYYDETYTNVQSSALSVSPITDQFQTTIINQGREKLQGFEAQVQVIPFSGLQLAASYAYMKNTYIDFTDVSLFGLPPGNFFGCSQTPIPAAQVFGSYQCGNVPAGGPENTYTLGASYQFPTPEAWGSMALHGDWYWQQGNVPSPATNLETHASLNNGFMKDYGNLDAGFDWRGVMGSHFDLSLWVRNLLNTEAATATDFRSAFTSVFSTVQINYALEPRLFGATVRYHLR